MKKSWMIGMLSLLICFGGCTDRNAEKILSLEKSISELRAEMAKPTVKTAPETEQSTVKNELPATVFTSAGPSYQVQKVPGGVEIVTYLGNEKNLTVPEEIDGRPVVSVGEGAFRNCPMETVILPDVLQKIGWFAFSGCYRLSSVTVGKRLDLIEYGAFDNCGKGLTIVCPENSYAAKYAESFGYPVKYR